MKKKPIIIIFIVLYVILVISYVFNFTKENYILFGTTTFVYYDDNNNIKKIKYVDEINKKLNYEKFKVYLNKKFDNYYINFYNEDNATFYNLYNEQYEKISSKELLLAVKGDLKVKVSNVQMETTIVDERDYLLDILKKHKINEEINVYSKQTLDIDNDNEKENIYMISNYGGKVNKVIYSYIFIEESNHSTIDVALTTNDPINTAAIKQKYHIWSVDLDNDNNYEIVVSSIDGDDSPVYYEFYKYDSHKRQVSKL